MTAQASAEPAPTVPRPRLRWPPQKQQAARVRRLLYEVALGVRGDLAVAVLGSLLRQSGFLAAPFLLSRAIDDGVKPGNPAATAWWCGAIALAAVAQYLGLCVWEYFGNRADARAGVALRTRLRTSVLSSGASSQAVGTGDLVVRAGRDVDAVRVWVHGLPTWAVIVMTVLVLVPGFAALDPWLLMVAAGTVPCLVALSLLYPRRFERASGHAAAAHGMRANVVDQIVRAGLPLRGIGAQDVILDRHREASEDLAQRTVRASGVLARWTALGEGVPAIATAVGVLVGALAALEGRLSIGNLVTFTGWMATVGIAVQVGLMRWTQGVDAKVGATRLLAVIGPRSERLERSAPDHRSDPEDVASTGVGSPAKARGGVRARIRDDANSGTRARVEARLTSQSEMGGEPIKLQVCDLVTIPGADPINLDLTAGCLVVVTGPVASGKSVLLRVLAGDQQPHAGHVLVDGVPIHRARSASGPEATGIQVVEQRPLALTGTVRDNLALGCATGDCQADDARYREALHTVGLDTELSSRAARDVLDLDLGEGGGELSGGQRQRLAVARALVADPRLVLLDDVTSAVDPHTASRLVTAMRKVSRTSIVVASGHNPFLLREADLVIDLGASAPEVTP
ncbi:ATP-binding cassette domain-containing protein [Devriesea agamarum]|uniref:ATP-binding cassette domain-containing protein n=1 Tax=Devriesea agamarum TaxID=472569 RepID=UPI00071D937A|nr:ABC transporter ATP-binding protein [Devriesea agamarum]